MKQSETMKKKPTLDPNAVVRSLHGAIITTQDYAAACTRLNNRLRRLPMEPLHPDHQHNGVFFYSNGNYLRKGSDQLYSLARRRYCESLLDVITLISEQPAISVQRDPLHSGKRDPLHSGPCAPAFAKLEKLIHDFADGRLELERILLTKRQYTWYNRDYPRKPFSGNQIGRDLFNPQGDRVMSKSEQNIGIALWDLAGPCHYEETLHINVQRLVDRLRAELQERGQLTKQLFYYQGGSCLWNVPEHLQWMNAFGSIWRTYDSRSGCIRIHPDYTIMLADGSLLYWEHEGLLENFVYRANSTERICVMQIVGGIPRENILETTEVEANDRQTLDRIIQDRILPGLWF